MRTFEDKRNLMVEYQLRRRGLRDERVLHAMETVPRHLFVPEKMVDMAYEDHPLPISAGQTISQPFMVALMTEAMELSGEECVLEIGTGSGYQAAVLSTLARTVISVERVPELAVQARDRLRSLGYRNITVVCGDGTLGYPEKAPYQGIMVTAGAPSIPPALKEQLAAKGGILVIPSGTSYMQSLIKLKRKVDRYSEAHLTGCVFVPLIGEQGWPEKDR